MANEINHASFGNLISEGFYFHCIKVTEYNNHGSNFVINNITNVNLLCSNSLKSHILPKIYYLNLMQTHSDMLYPSPSQGCWSFGIKTKMWGMSRSVNFPKLKFQNFNSIQFNSIQFNSIQFNSIQFNSIQFNSIQFNSIQFNSIQFNSIQFNSIQFNSIQFNSIQSDNLLILISSS